MKHTTSSKPIAIDSVPLLIESAPKDAPTVLSSAIVTGTGKAPALKTIAMSSGWYTTIDENLDFPYGLKQGGGNVSDH